MRRSLRLLPIVLTLLSGVPRAQRAADGFVLPDDLEIALWAESPMFFNPTNIDVDARGRIWVAEGVNYRDFNTAKSKPLTHADGDRIVVFPIPTAMGALTSRRCSSKTRTSAHRSASR